MSEAIKKVVQKYLRPEETCIVAGDVKFLKHTSNKHRARIFALVHVASRRRETAVLTFKAKRFQAPELKGIYPVNGLFRVRAGAEFGFTLLYENAPDEQFQFEASSRAMVKELLVPLMTALKAAREIPSLDFSWLCYYNVAEEPDNNIPDLSVPMVLAGGAGPDDGSGMAGASASAMGMASSNPLITTSASLYSSRALSSIKDEWLAEQMRAREDEFTEQLPLKIFTGTYNVNGKKPGEALDAWLCEHGACDVFAIAFQELDLSAEAFLINNSQRSGPWETQIESSLAKLGSYALVCSRQLVGMLLTVYASVTIMPHVIEVQADSVGVGVMGVMGNKGAVAVRFRLHDSTVCFVNSHLAARQKEIERRNQDHKEICRRLAFPREDTGMSRSIFDHDYLFWMGDLNYRISLPDDEVKAKIAEQDWAHLVQHDQLTVQRAAKASFVGFSEGPLDFCPTYKYDPGTNRFDTSEKKRIPAWCDRVLYIARHNYIRQLFYGRHELLTSDHKPVSALFEARSRIVIRERRAAIYHAVVRELDQLENESMPDASLSESSFVFDDVVFGVPQTQTFTIANTGQVVIKWSFIPKPGDIESGFCKPYVTLEPDRGLLMPGASVELQLTVKVDRASAQALNMGAGVEDIIILHLDGGKDYFLNVRGSYRASCFGASLPFLVCTRGPVRTATVALDSFDAPCYAVPKELWSLVDWLYTQAATTRSLFTSAGDGAEMDTIREALDTGVPLRSLSVSAFSVAEVLLRLLASLHTPVVPPRLAARCLEAAPSADASRDIVGVFPTVHYNVFVYLMAFLRELLALQPDASAAELAFVFASVFFVEDAERDGAGAAPDSADTARRKALFVMRFLDPHAADELKR